MPRDKFQIKRVHTALEADKLPELDKFLMRYYSISAFIAPTNSGKSNLIINLLNRRPFYRKKFDTIILISSTYEIDPVWKKAKGIDVVYEDYDDAIIEELIAEQKAFLAKSDRNDVPNVLLILDDIVDRIPKTKSALNSLSMRLRHYKVTCWITTQKFNRLPTAFRNQVQYWILFRSAAKNELERAAIAREVGSMVNETVFMKLWEACGSNNWDFLVVHTRSPEGKMFRKGFISYLKPVEYIEDGTSTH